MVECTNCGLPVSPSLASDVLTSCAECAVHIPKCMHILVHMSRTIIMFDGQQLSGVLF